MAKYIDREKAVELIDTCIESLFCHPKFSKEPYTIAKTVRAVVAALCPTSDVAEVKHGVWGDTGIEHLDLIYSGYKCSECGEIICGNKFPYCPNCGAKMDGKEQGK